MWIWNVPTAEQTVCVYAAELELAVNSRPKPIIPKESLRYEQICTLFSTQSVIANLHMGGPGANASHHIIVDVD